MTKNDIVKYIESLRDHLSPRLFKFLEILVERLEADGPGKFVADKKEVLAAVTTEEKHEILSQDVRNRLRELNKGVKAEAAESGKTLALKFASRKNHFVTELLLVEKANASKQALIASSNIDAKEVSENPALLRAREKNHHVIFFSHAWENDENEAVLDDFVNRMKVKISTFESRSKGAFSASIWIDRENVGASRGSFEDYYKPACEGASIAVYLCADRWFASEACQNERKITEKADKRVVKIQFTGNRFTGEFATNPMFPETWNGDYKNLLEVMDSSTSNIDNFVTSVANEIFDILTSLNPEFDPDFDADADADAKLDTSTGRIVIRSSRVFGQKSKAQIQDGRKILDLSPHAELDKIPEENKAGFEIDSMGFPLVQHLMEWVNSEKESNRIYAILGSFGTGKSTCSRQFVDAVNEAYLKNPSHPFAIYLDFRRLIEVLGKYESFEIGAILKLSLHPEYREKIDSSALLELLRQENCVIVFDGLDEIGTSIGEDKAASLYRQLLEIINSDVRKQDAKLGKADWSLCRTRLIITCRSQFFRDHIQQESVLTGRDRQTGITPESVKTLYMLPFTEEQIENYFHNNLDPSIATRTYEFVSQTHDLLGLARKPLLMTYIMEMVPDLIRDQKQGRVINLARIYHHMFRRVVERDGDKRPLLNPDDREKILKDLAAFLWSRGLTQIPVSELQNWFDEYSQDHIVLKTLYNSCLLYTSPSPRD